LRRHVQTPWNPGDVQNNNLTSRLTRYMVCVGLERPWDPGIIAIHKAVGYIIIKGVRMPFGAGSRSTCYQISELLRRYIYRGCLQTVLRPDRAIAWGQAMFFGGGNVMTALMEALGRVALGRVTLGHGSALLGGGRVQNIYTGGATRGRHRTEIEKWNSSSIFLFVFLWSKSSSPSGLVATTSNRCINFTPRSSPAATGRDIA
jgi:hypothetical protein